MLFCPQCQFSTFAWICKKNYTHCERMSLRWESVLLCGALRKMPTAQGCHCPDSVAVWSTSQNTQCPRLSPPWQSALLCEALRKMPRAQGCHCPDRMLSCGALRKMPSAQSCNCPDRVLLCGALRKMLLFLFVCLFFFCFILCLVFFCLFVYLLACFRFVFLPKIENHYPWLLMN